MSAFIVVDTSPSIESVRNHTHEKTAKKKELRAKVNAALTLAGGRLSSITDGNLFVGEFATESRARQAIALLQRSPIAAKIGIGQDATRLAGRKSKKWLEYTPVTDTLPSAVWSSTRTLPKEFAGQTALEDYSAAANLLSAPLIEDRYSPQQSQAALALGTRAFGDLRKNAHEARYYIPAKETKRLAGVGVEFLTDGKDDYRLVFHWKDAGWIAPERIQFRGKNLKVRNEVSGEFTLQAENLRQRPPYIGCGISRLRANGIAPPKGSIGCIVRKKDAKDTLYFLSASHVMGDGPDSRAGAAIVQPAQMHGGGADDVIGTVVFASYLERSPIPNEIDAALAKVELQKVLRSVGLGHQYITGVGKPNPNMKIWKVGAGNGGPHQATINELLPTLTFNDTILNRSLVYHNVWACSPGYSMPGDSGCSVLEVGTNRIVGLHLGGNTLTSYFIDINTVIDKLNIQIATDAAG